MYLKYSLVGRCRCKDEQDLKGLINPVKWKWGSCWWVRERDGAAEVLIPWVVDRKTDGTDGCGNTDEGLTYSSHPPQSVEDRGAGGKEVMWTKTSMSVMVFLNPQVGSQIHITTQLLAFFSFLDSVYHGGLRDIFLSFWRKHQGLLTFFIDVIEKF